MHGGVAAGRVGADREGHVGGVGGHRVAAGVLDVDDRLGGEGVSAVPPVGGVVTASLAAAPAVMLKVPLVRWSGPWRWLSGCSSLPAGVERQAAKVATPATAATVLACRQGAAAGAGGKGDRRLLVVTVLPPASSTFTTGWGPKAVAPVELDGYVVTASWAAAPAVMVKVAWLRW